VSFELTIAMKRDPVAGLFSNDGSASPPPYAAIVLNGLFDDAASNAVLKMVTDASDEGAASILVDMEAVVADDAACLQAFAERLMSLRRTDIHVQVVVHESGLHEHLAILPDSRDWLIAFTDAPVAGPRRALHVDGPGVTDR